MFFLFTEGILKSSSFDKQFGATGWVINKKNNNNFHTHKKINCLFLHISSNNRKSAKFDELNVLQTYHPPNKDYGHMKVDEPKTPYNYLDPRLAEQDELDATVLAEKLKVAQETARRASIHAEESDEDDDAPESDEHRDKRIEFEKRRKLHYNEASAIKLARKLIEEEIEDDHLNDEDAAAIDAARGTIQDSNDEDELLEDCDDKEASTSTQNATESVNP